MSTLPPKIDKYESRRIRVEIRRVLLQVWDPIGVKNAPDAQDEYDSYVGNLYEFLVEGSSDSEIAKYLDSVAVEGMGFSTSPVSVTNETVRALRAIPLVSGATEKQQR